MSTDLTAAQVKRLEAAVAEWMRPKSSAEYGGDLVRDFLAPAVAIMLTEAATEAEVALREHLLGVIAAARSAKGRR